MIAVPSNPHVYMAVFRDEAGLRGTIQVHCVGSCTQRNKDVLTLHVEGFACSIHVRGPW